MNLGLWFNSFAVGFGALGVAVVAGLIAAITAATGGPRLRWICVLGGAVTLALPPFLPANCWLELTAGWRSELSPEAAANAMLPVTALVLGLGLWPLTMFFVLGAWRRLQSAQLEAESALRGWAVVRWLLWPAARASLFPAAVLTLTLALASFTVPTLFQVRVFTEEFWIRYNTQLDLRGALAATWPLWLMPLALGWVFRSQAVTWPRHELGLRPELLRARIGGWAGWTRGATLALMLASLVVPLGRLVGTFRTWTELPGALAAGQNATLNSFLAAAGTSFAVTLLAGCSSYPVPLWVHRGLTSLHSILWLFFLLPGVFLAVALIGALNRPGFIWLYSGFGIVFVALSLRFLAPVRTAIVAATQAGDRELSEAATLAGAKRWDQFRWVIWPQSGTSLLAVAYTVYLLCLWDVESLVLLQPPGGETLALRVFNLLHYGHAAQVNALCVILLALALLPLAAAYALTSPRRQPRMALAVAIGTSLFGAGLVGCSRDAAVETVHSLPSELFSAVQIIGSRGVAPGQFNKPRSLVCDREDNLYVTDMTGRVQKFTPDGRFVLQWQMPETEVGKPKGMTLDPAGNIVVVEPHYQRVNHFTPEGRLVAQWGRRGTNAGEFILPRCVAINPEGEYYLGEYTTVERVQRLTLREAPGHGAGGRPAAGWPYALAGVWGQPGQAPGDFNRAEGIAIGPRAEVYVADSCNHRIQVFARDGTFLRVHGRAGAQAGSLSYPYDVRVEPSGVQFVCEFGNSRVSIFDASDRLVEVIGRAGTEPGQFANPWSICFDSHGNLYVADSQNHRVQKLLRRTPFQPGPSVADSGLPKSSPATDK